MATPQCPEAFSAATSNRLKKLLGYFGMLEGPPESYHGHRGPYGEGCDVPHDQTQHTCDTLPHLPSALSLTCVAYDQLYHGGDTDGALHLPHTDLSGKEEE